MAGDTEYKREWAKGNLDRISLTVKKGQKTEMQAHTAVQKESLNQFINRAISETIERDQKHDTMLPEAEALAKALTDLGQDTTVQKAIELLEAFSALESVVPTAKQQYISAVESKYKKSSFVPIPVPTRLRER